MTQVKSRTPRFRIIFSIENRLNKLGTQLNNALRNQGEQFLSYASFANLVLLAGVTRLEAADEPLELLRELRKELRQMDEALKQQQAS
jgi:hypothetical protein